MIGRIILNTLSSKKPTHLILHVTSQCQLKCKTCFNRDSDVSIPDLDINKIKEVSKYINNPIWLEISGGEPFLREDLPEICNLFNANLVSLSTNGQNPKRIFKIATDIKKKLKKSVTLNIAVSIDGFKNPNDYIRGKNSFLNAIKTLKLLKKIPDIKIKVNTVLCDPTYDNIINFMKFIKTFNPSFHSIILLRGKPRDSRLKPPSLKKLNMIKKDIFKIWDTYDYGIRNPIKRQILRNYQKASFEASLQVIEKKEQIPKCLAGTKHLVVYPNGNVSFCEMLDSMGNISQEDVNKVLKSKNASIQREKIRAKACFCYHNCNMLDNFFLNPHQYPYLIIKK